MMMDDFLDVEFEDMDIGTTTPRKYCEALLTKLFEEGETFSAKRPFGNSGWGYDLIAAMIRAEIVTGDLDEDGCAQNFDWQQVEAAQIEMVKAVCAKGAQ